jgi:hypothetical protein
MDGFLNRARAIAIRSKEKVSGVRRRWGGKHTLLAATELGTLSTDFSIESIREGSDEVENVGVTTGCLNFLLGNFFNGLGSSE